MSGVFHVGDEAYDDFMGRYSVRLAPLFAEFAGVHEGQRALDVGAGTGALTAELARRGATAVAAEPSPEFTAALRRRLPGVEVVQAPAEDLPFDDESFDVALAQLVLAFVADGPASAREMLRVARTAAVCMWGLDEVEMFAAFRRTAEEMGTGHYRVGATRYRTQQELIDLLEPFGEVDTGELDVTAQYSGFDEFCTALNGQVGPAGAWMKSLDEEQQRRAHEILYRELGSPSGPFELSGRAFAARVTRA